MPSERRILAALDDSAAARPVLASSLGLAELLGAHVEAVQITGRPGLTARACADAARVPYRSEPGDPLERLLFLAAPDEVAAVALGARGRPSGPRPAGRLALAVADRLGKPTLLTPPDAPVTTRIGRALLALESTPSHAKAVRRVVDAPGAGQLDLVVVHVDEETTVPWFSDQVQHEAESFAAEFLARYCPGAPHARLALRVGQPTEQILGVADELAPDLLVMGWPPSGPGRGAVVRAVLGATHLPVLLVPLAAGRESP